MLSDQALSLLACTRCRGGVSATPEGARCAACGTQLAIRDGVIVARPEDARSYFDDIFEVMQLSNREPGTWEIFYRQQTELAGKSIGDGDVVLDIGCGPNIAYSKNGSFVVGLDASFQSIRANRDVDMRLFASAASLPLRDACADVILCFYSIHHMTGRTVTENRALVRQVFAEFARVLKPGARLLVFEVSPHWPLGVLEWIFWSSARRLLGPALDMFFWPKRRLAMLAEEIAPGAKLTIREFSGNPLTTFPPIFSKQWFRLPRVLYPFAVSLYEWRMPAKA